METRIAAAKNSPAYVVNMLDRWLILALIIGLSLAFCKPLFGYSIYFRGVSFEESFQFAAAEVYYQKAVDEYARIPEAWNALAQMHLMRARIDPAELTTALGVLHRGIAANPQDATLPFTLCRADYEVERDYGSALTACRASVALNPENPFAWDYAAWASVRLGHTSQAISYWHRVLGLVPTDGAVMDALTRYNRACAAGPLKIACKG